jgi:cobalt-zinc-cadmium efflux system protein
MTRPGSDDVAANTSSLASVAEPATGHEFEHGADAGRRDQRWALGWALGLNGLLLVVEVAGGIAFGSLALLADAVHLVSDVAGLAIALGAVILTARPVSLRHSFGLARAEVLAAQVSALLLITAGGWILFESVNRLRDPVPVDGAGLAAVATVGLAVNLGSAALVHRSQGESLNMRASFLHLATDAAGSLGAAVAGLLILEWGWDRADSLVSMATAVLVLWTGWGLLRESTHVLMEGTPRGLEAEVVRAAILEVDGVADVHHMHLWNLASDVPTLSVHIVVTGEPSLRDAQRTAERVRAALSEHFSLTHMTLELECMPPDDTSPAIELPAAEGQAEEAPRSTRQDLTL